MRTNVHLRVCLHVCRVCNSMFEKLSSETKEIEFKCVRHRPLTPIKSVSFPEHQFSCLSAKRSI